MVPLLVSCNPSGVVTKHDFCERYEPVFVSRKDVLTDGTARPILNNNETYKALCPDLLLLVPKKIIEDAPLPNHGAA